MFERCRRRSAGILDHDRARRHTMLYRVALADRRLTRRIAIAEAAGEDDLRCQAATPQIDRVIQPRTQHRRRPANILRRAEDDDRRRRLRGVAALPDDDAGQRYDPRAHHERAQQPAKLPPVRSSSWTHPRGAAPTPAPATSYRRMRGILSWSRN